MSKPVKTILVLRAARKLVANPKTWTKYVMARDAHGLEVSTTDKRAVCWCATGALYAACDKAGLPPEELRPLRVALWRIASREYGGNQDLPGVNDFHGRLAALSILDSAIQELVDRGEA